MILDRIRSTRAATLANPSEWLTEVLTSGRSIAGISVTEESALKFSAVFACIRVIAETVSTLPLPIYQRVSDQERRRVPDHAIAAKLNVRPNPEQSAVEAWENVIGFLNLWGRSPIYIERHSSKPWDFDLWPLPPNRVREVRDPDKDFARIGYLIDVHPRGEQQILGNAIGVDVNDLVDLRAFGYAGNSTPIRRHAEAIGLGLAAEEYAARLFSNDGRPGGVVEFPEGASRESAERFAAKWAERHEGLTRSQLVGILTAGAKWKDVGMPARDAQMIEARKFSVEEIARAFRVPLHKIADLDRATFSNIEEQNIDFVTDTIRPWCVRIEQGLRYLFDPTLKNYGKAGDEWAEFNLDGLLRGDIEKRTKAYAMGRQWGWWSADDVRAKEGEGPLPDDAGKTYLVPANMENAANLSEGDGSDPDKGPTPGGDPAVIKIPGPAGDPEENGASGRAATVRD